MTSRNRPPSKRRRSKGPRAAATQPPPREGDDRVRLQKVLAALVRLGPPDLATAAMRMSSTALTFSRDGLLLDEHREAVLRASRG